MKMTRLDRRFADLQKQGKKGFIAYLSAGDPNLEDTVDIVLRLEDAGWTLSSSGSRFPIRWPMAA